MERMEESLKFKEWKKSLLENGIQIASIEEQYSVHKKSGEVLFSFIKINAIDPEGVPLLPYALIRGHFVSVVTVLIDKDSGKKFFLLVKQRRVANGKIFFEHPAGMTDSEKDPYKVAIKEVQEETGLVIERSDLKLLYERPLYSSPGLLDEAGYFFYCEINLDSNELEKYKNKLAGAKGESEHIETFICSIDEVYNYIDNSNGILASMLYISKTSGKGN